MKKPAPIKDRRGRKTSAQHVKFILLPPVSQQGTRAVFDNNELPPPNARRVYRWDDLPETVEPALYEVIDEGQAPRTIVVSKNTRRVLEGLMQGPLFAASYCRISDKVLPLRRDHGVAIDCNLYRNDAETGRERYGIYQLASTVRRVTGENRK